MNIQMPPTTLSGQFRMVVSEDAECKKVKHDTGFFDNLITDVGLNRVGASSNSLAGLGSSLQIFQGLCGRFVVGSGSATPAFTDTALVAPVAFASANPTLVSESSSYSRGWYEITVRHGFGQGQAAGNLSEIGIQLTNTSGPLWSRALILDGIGNPTTITVLPDDFLTCFYTLRIMIPEEDAVFNIDVDYDEDGIIPTVVTARPAATESTRNLQGWGLQTFSTRLNESPSQDSVRFFGGGLAVPEANNPGGGSLGVVGSYGEVVPYISGTFNRYGEINASLGAINSDNLSTVLVTFLMGCWQINFNPPLQKNNTQTMKLTFGYSWARA